MDHECQLCETIVKSNHENRLSPFWQISNDKKMPNTAFD